MSFKCARAKARSLNDEGTILVMVALMLPFLIGAVGLAIDVGNIEVIRRQEQAAADAAAIAGARELFDENGSTAAATAAQDSATQNGFTNGVNNVTVTVNNPPKSGPNSGSSYAVEVIVSQVQSTFFMGVLGKPKTTVSARAVGALGASSTCIQITGPVGEGIDLDGGFILNAPTCGIYIDSTNTGPPGAIGDQSLTTHGGGAYCNPGSGYTSSSTYVVPGGDPLVVAAFVSTAAPYYNQGVCIGNASAGPNIAPNFGVEYMPDMLGYLPQPSTSAINACDQYNAAGVSGNGPMTITGTKTLSPGSYCGGIWIKSGANVTFSAGTYILNGGNTEGGSFRTSL